MAWTFLDPVTSETVRLNVAPNDGGSPFYQKNLSVVPTTSPVGSALVFEGRTSPISSSFHGEGRTQQDYQLLLEWFQKRYPIKYTDDLGRQFTIVITQYTPKRSPLRHYMARFTYDVNYVVLDASNDILPN